MTSRPYRSEIQSGGYEEAHDVSVGVAGSEAVLTCRWPSGRPPVGYVLFCHGLGSSGRGYEALSRHWARHGYLVIHPTFADAIARVARDQPALGLDPQADLSGWMSVPAARTAMFEILHDPVHWVERVETVRRVMHDLDDVFAATCGRPARRLPGAIAGHSFGAYTAQLLAGAEIDLSGGIVGRFRDDRFNAAILLSAQGRDQQGLREGSWDPIDGPVLTVTGTLDRGANGGDWHWKSEPFELAPPGEKYLAVLADGDHHLGGFAENGWQPQVAAQQEAVRQLTLAFLDAHVQANSCARDWLASVGGLVAECPLEFRRK